MKLARQPIALAAVLVLLAGCSDSTGITVEDMAGTWRASSFTFTSVSDPNHQVDLVEDEGITFQITINSDETFNGFLSVPSLSPLPLPIGGVLEIHSGAGTLDVRFNEQTLGYGLVHDFTAHFTIDSSRQLMVWTYDDTTFDFPQNPDVGAEPAVADLVLDRW
jgi:hypothetical protein